MAKRAIGFMPTKQFAHKAKHRNSPVDTPRTSRTVVSSWDRLTSTVRRVDTERINHKGTLYQPTNMEPRLVLSDSRYDELMKRFGGKAES